MDAQALSETKRLEKEVSENIDLILIDMRRGLYGGTANSDVNAIRLSRPSEIVRRYADLLERALVRDTFYRPPAARR